MVDLKLQRSYYHFHILNYIFLRYNEGPYLKIPMLVMVLWHLEILVVWSSSLKYLIE